MPFTFTVKTGKRTAIVCSVILFLISLSIYTPCFAAPTVSVSWNQTYSGFGELARTVIQTSDGSYALLCTDYNFGNPNYASGVFYLLKVDSTGHRQWNCSYTGSIFDVDSGQYLVQTSDGGYASIAEYQSKLMLIKIDAQGKEQWSQIYAGSGTCIPSAIIKTSDGGFAVLAVSNYYTGPSYPPASYSNTVWLVKTNSTGSLQWSKTYGLGDANSLIQTSDGGYAIGGQSSNVNSGYLLIKADSNGNLDWNKTFVHQDENFLCTVAQTSDNGFALGGWIWLRSNGGGPNVAITKTDSAGNEQWTNYYGAGSAFTMTKTNDGGFGLAGQRLVKVDSAGNQQWAIGLSGQPSSVIQTSDGGYALSGFSGIVPWLTKIDVANPNQTVQPSQSQSPTPTPTAPEAAWLAILPVFIFILSIAIIIGLGLVVCFRKHKT
jgi:hypothetical protein